MHATCLVFGTPWFLTFFVSGKKIEVPEAPRNDLGHAAATSTRRSASGCGCALVEASRSSLEGAVFMDGNGCLFWVQVTPLTLQVLHGKIFHKWRI